MPKLIRKLTEKEVRNAPIKEKPYRLCDEGGLRLLVRPTGKKVWQYPYRYNGKANIYTIGQYYPSERAGYVTMAEARTIRDEVKAIVKDGVDPNQYKKSRSIGSLEHSNTTFEAVAREWHAKGTWVKKHAQNIIRSLERDVFAHIGAKQIDDVTPQDIIAILSLIQKRGACDVAKRTCQRCEAIFDYAIIKDICQTNPAAGRAKFIKSVKSKNRPHLKEHQVGEFLHLLDGYHGRDYITLAMRMLTMTFVRPGELRWAVWKEIDIENALWRIPAKRMKMDRDHTVPLSRQAISLLQELREITGHSDYLFPSVRSPHKPISDVTLLKVVKLLGYVGKKKIVPHGFRHTASTILNEHGYNSDWVEKQLSHEDKNKIRGTYNHASYLDERTRMMQWYSDHLDTLKEEYRAKKSKTAA